MASRKNSDSGIDLTKPYEENRLGFKGILWFAAGLVGLMIVTFALMWGLLNVLKDYRQENAGPVNPLGLSEKERLPPEPRLQLAPGFGVDSQKGRLNLELVEPHSEYLEVRRQWDEALEKGEKDEKTGAVSSLPIEEAKAKLLSQNVKAKSGADADTEFNNSRMLISDASAAELRAADGDKDLTTMNTSLLKGIRTTFSILMLGSILPPTAAYSQKTEQYNSPLYSPRYYDPAVSTSNGLPAALTDVGIEQKLGTQLPLDTELKDEDGNIIKLGSIFNTGRPVVVAFVYYDCPMLCNQVLNGLTGALKGMSLDAGKDYDVAAISFDAREFDKPDLAKNKKANYLERYNRPGTEKGWHFLTGQKESIDKLTSAAGFNYKWDEKSGQFAHAAGIMIATPDGKLSRYLYGIDYAPKDLKFGIMESAGNKVGSPAEKLLLYCYHYDPATGKYGLAILKLMRVGGIVTLIGMGAMGFIFWRRNRKKEQLAEEG